MRAGFRTRFFGRGGGVCREARLGHQGDASHVVRLRQLRFFHIRRRRRRYLRGVRSGERARKRGRVAVKPLSWSRGGDRAGGASEGRWATIRGEGPPSPARMSCFECHDMSYASRHRISYLIYHHTRVIIGSNDQDCSMTPAAYSQPWKNGFFWFLSFVNGGCDRGITADSGPAGPRPGPSGLYSLS
jgi:hypothetical protein